MEWIMEPLNGFKEIELVKFDACCSNKAYVGQCAWYLECNCTGTLIVQK